MADNSAVRVELQAQLDQLLKLARDIEVAHGVPATRNTREKRSETKEEDHIASINDTLRGEIAEIQLAIDLIDNDRYGRCTICHQEISPDLLAKIPYATRCVACDLSSCKP